MAKQNHSSDFLREYLKNKAPQIAGVRLAFENEDGDVWSQSITPSECFEGKVKYFADTYVSGENVRHYLNTATVLFKDGRCMVCAEEPMFTDEFGVTHFEWVWNNTRSVGKIFGDEDGHRYTTSADGEVEHRYTVFAGGTSVTYTNKSDAIIMALTLDECLVLDNYGRIVYQSFD